MTGSANVFLAILGRGLFFAALLTSLNLISGEIRNFTNFEGKQVRAEYLGLVGENVRMRTANGKVLYYPLAKLSENDRKYVEDNPNPKAAPVETSSDRDAKRNLIRDGLNQLEYKDGQLYYLYAPKKVLTHPLHTRILVSVHGYSGRKNSESGRQRVLSAAEMWRPLADEQKWVVLAPHFDEERFENDYQRLNFFGKVKADDRLHDLISELAAFLPGIESDKIFLFGFSGGGQFVHRYALFHPDRIERAVAGGAGWYTFPDTRLPYPIGIESGSLPRERKPDLKKLFDVPLLIIVGEKDENEGDFLTSYDSNGSSYDLLSLQGSGRRQRASNWVAAMRKETSGNEFAIQFAVIPETGHTISSEFLTKATEFLKGAN